MDIVRSHLVPDGLFYLNTTYSPDVQRTAALAFLERLADQEFHRRERRTARLRPRSLGFRAPHGDARWKNRCSTWTTPKGKATYERLTDRNLDPDSPRRGDGLGRPRSSPRPDRRRREHRHRGQHAVRVAPRRPARSDEVTVRDLCSLRPTRKQPAPKLARKVVGLARVNSLRVDGENSRHAAPNLVSSGGSPIRHGWLAVRGPRTISPRLA